MQDGTGNEQISPRKKLVRNDVTKKDFRYKPTCLPDRQVYKTRACNAMEGVKHPNLNISKNPGI